MSRTANFFDTLLFAQAMRESGMNEKTANTLAEELKKFREDSVIASQDEASNQKILVTTDLNSFKSEMHQEFKLVRSEINQEFKLVRSEIKTLEQKILGEIKNATLIIVLGLGTIIALVQKFL